MICKNLFAAAVLLASIPASALAQQYDCLGTISDMRGVIREHYSLETHQGFSELAYRSDTDPNWVIIATYDGNHPKPGDSSDVMTFTHVSKKYHDMPVKVQVGDDWMRVDSVMFTDLCREAK